MVNSIETTPLGPTPPLRPRPKIRVVVVKQSRSITLTSHDPLKAAITKTNEASPLLALPKNTRTKIFSYVFTTNQAIEFLIRDPRTPSLPLSFSRTTSVTPQTTTTTTTAAFPALFVCRQLYLDTQLLPFACNTLHCSNTWNLTVCLAHLRPDQCRAITAILLRWFTVEAILRDAKVVDDAARSADAALRALPGLERIVVDAPGKAACTQLRVHADLHGWLAQRRRPDVRIVMGREDGEDEVKKQQQEAGRQGGGTLAEFNERFQRRWGPKNLPRKKPRLAAAKLRRVLTASKARDAEGPGAVPWSDHKGECGRKQEDFLG